ncbi:semaphorin-5B-like [Gigantopelta aegis]|uniref:semaphorin-5B-like n=1 Tax=Gigantopelta aegis TaxID=1735272 RepID=UPI001B88B1AD|nr:semaphorin-5B-like [Gigantopelta aegis]
MCRGMYFWLLAVSVVSAFYAESVQEEIIPSDFRYTNYEAMVQQFNIFQNPDLNGYVQITLDLDRDQLLVGARGCIFRLSMSDLEVIQVADWNSNNETRDICIKKGFSAESCHNFIRVLFVFKDKVFVCGTNAFDPICSWRLADNIEMVNETIKGRAICPYNPNQNVSSIMTGNGDLYTATTIDSTSRDPAISRNLGPSRRLRTVQFNSKWLNEPNFVSAYEIGDFVYFFFRETAVEFINCGKKIYSRVARICKTDRGGTFVLEDNWITFLKARMNCSIPGDFPFYLDEIQSTYYSESKQLIYAIFTTPPNSIAGSAVCVYNITAFEKTFTGPFKYQEDSKAAWVRHGNNKPMERCASAGSGSKRSTQKSADDLEQANRYQLMNSAVQPQQFYPLLFGKNERWTHVVIDHVEGKRDTYEVVFLATADGKIRKMLKLVNVSTVCLVEEIKIVPNGEPKPVKAMKISHEKAAIYLSTSGNIIKIPVARCERFTDSDLCMNAADPYCGWDISTRKCTQAPRGNPHADHWHQHISGCPIVQYPINGAWSKWSQWGRCQMVGTDQTGEECWCRHRNCDSPKPYYGGRPCVGQSVEVTNCTVHGNWTQWSQWSRCSKSCGYAVKHRERHCSNPSPKFGGSVCVGRALDSQYCKGSLECPSTPINGKWSHWSGWSKCTYRCNGGIQTRRRTCDKPLPSRGGIPCIGNKQEWRMCNTQHCDELSKITPWTQWFKTNYTKGGYFEQRFRYFCRANVAEKKMIKSSHAKTQGRFCFSNGRGCYKPGELRNTITSMDTFSSVDRVLKKFCRYRRKLFRKYCNCRTLGVFLVFSEHLIGGHLDDTSSDWSTNVHPDSPIGGNQDSVSDWSVNTETYSVIGGNRDGAWSDWSAWSVCSVDCNGGMQWRSRSCDNPQPIGNGSDCQGSWSCWSEFSPCSVTCGSGVKTRTRSCMGLDKGKVIYYPCLGNGSQTRSCEKPFCKEDDAALHDPWTQWSPCTRDHLQYRHRRCSVATVSDRHCKADMFDVKRCRWTESDIRVASAISETNMVRKIGGIYLIIVAIVAFVIGGLASVGLYMYVQHHREQQLKEEELWKNSSKPQDFKTVNLIGSSQISLDFHNLNLNNNNRFSVNTYNSLKKEKLTVNEASSLKKNSKRDSMWTNLSINDL